MNKIAKELDDVSFFSDFYLDDVSITKKIASPFDLIFNTNKEHKQRKKFEEKFEIDPIIFNISEGLFRALPNHVKNNFHINFYKFIKEKKDYYYLWYNLVTDLLKSLVQKRKGVEKDVSNAVLDLYLISFPNRGLILKTIKEVELKKDLMEKDFFYFSYCLLMSLKDPNYIKLFFEMSYFKKAKREKMALFYHAFLTKDLENN